MCFKHHLKAAPFLLHMVKSYCCPQDKQAYHTDLSGAESTSDSVLVIPMLCVLHCIAFSCSGWSRSAAGGSAAAGLHVAATSKAVPTAQQWDRAPCCWMRSSGSALSQSEVCDQGWGQLPKADVAVDACRDEAHFAEHCTPFSGLVVLHPNKHRYIFDAAPVLQCCFLMENNG